MFRRTDSKGKRLSRVVYLPDKAFEVTERLCAKHGDDGRPLFRNSSRRAWTKDSVGCAFLAIQMRMGKAEMQRRGESISDEQVAEFVPSLAARKTVKGQIVAKTEAELRTEARRKLTYKRASELAPR